MKWITRERPKIDRMACPWLIRRFIGPEAVFFYVPFEQAISKAEELEAIPYDIPGVEFTHYEDRCTFDYLIEKFAIDDQAVKEMAPIVRDRESLHLSAKVVTKHEILPLIDTCFYYHTSTI